MTTIGPRRVLIVENEPLTAATLATELGSSGYHVCGVATTPDDALAAVVRDQPHVVLMDVRLADGGDGIDTARRICLGRDTAIVFLTAQSDEATLARALEVSPFGFLVKPFRARELKVAIEVAVTKQAKDAAAAREWQELATTDPLTRLPNRRKLAEVLRTEWDRCRQDGVSIAALMIDVDHFKDYNDTYGHPAGDACLVAVAEAIRGSCGRPGDFLCRWGGEEFLAILPTTDITAAAHVAERVLAAVRRQQLQHRGSPTDTILTVSVGGAAVVPAISMRADDLIATADHSLYNAKRRGRNRAVFERLDAGDVPGEAPPRRA